MANNESRHIGDEQLVYGLPKRMSARANAKDTATTPAEAKAYWHYVPKPKACTRCQAMKGILFEEDPGPVHDYCKCERERVVSGHAADGHTTIIVPPGVDIEANIREAKRVAKQCEKEAVDYASRVPSYASNPASIPVMARNLKIEWVKKMFSSGAPYDYKKLGNQYESFGNYHYGLYVKALGIGDTLARMSAGYYQIRSGTSSIDFLGSWFDDPEDQKNIIRGQQFPLE